MSILLVALLALRSLASAQQLPASAVPKFQEMLDAIGDPLIKTITQASARGPGAFHTELTADGILPITVPGSDYRDSIQALRQAGAQIPKARGIVFDLRAPIYHPQVFARIVQTLGN
jgi:hypothetical protein